jgi:hypothetical protein
MPIAKAITLQAEHALDVLYAGKRVENRSWLTNYRGPLYLHVASVRLSKQLRLELAQRHRLKALPKNIEGHLIATMELVECTKKTPRGQKKWARRGAWHFILDNVKPLRRPIKMPGQLGIWGVRRARRRGKKVD